MTSEILLHAGFGFLGGLVRGLVGLWKNYRATKKTEFKPKYLGTTVIVSALIGAFVAFALVVDYRISILAGYAGIDLLESILKIYKKKR